jgi:hypothetical protein
MNREQAIRAVADKIGPSGPFTNNLVDAMEAVGVLKLDEPASAVCPIEHPVDFRGMETRTSSKIEARVMQRSPPTPAG